jgi:hypothetical protein
MLFFFFFQEPYHKVKINLTFQAPNGENPSLEELNEFLDAISKLHEYAILNTQPEYFENHKPSIHNAKVFEYHKLEVTQICRKNPFDVKLTFFIIKEGLITYWPIIKAFMSLCKRYGKNANHLDGSIEYLRMQFERFFDIFILNSILSKLFGFLKIYNDKEKLLEKLRSNLSRLMSDPKFREYYDKICSTSITITNLVSSVESINERIDLLNDKN